MGQAMRRLRPRQEIRTGRMVSRQAIHTGTSRQMEHQQMKCRKMERRSIREHGILTCGGAGGIRHPGRIHAGTGRSRAGGCIQGRQTGKRRIYRRRRFPSMRTIFLLIVAAGFRNPGSRQQQNQTCLSGKNQQGRTAGETPGTGSRNPGKGQSSMGTNISRDSKERRRQGNRRRLPGRHRRSLPSWSLPLTSCRRKRRTESSHRQ